MNQRLRHIIMRMGVAGVVCLIAAACLSMSGIWAGNPENEKNIPDRRAEHIPEVPETVAGHTIVSAETRSPDEPGPASEINRSTTEESERGMPPEKEPCPFYLKADLVGWDDRVGDQMGLWISVPRQELYLIAANEILWSIPCATALTGVGSRINSNQTPPGWHQITQKIGDNEAKGRVFRSRAPTAHIWQPGDETDEDLVLTRVFILDGLEKGINKGIDAEGIVVDSRQRYIYIHGTNDEERLGEPSSKGCVRVSNNDAIALYDRVPVGTLVYIEPD